MRNKKSLIVIAMVSALAPLAVCAANEPFPSTMRGIHFVSMSKQKLSGNVKKEMFKEFEQEKSLGYIEDKEDAKFLLNFEKYAPGDLEAGKTSPYGVYDTHLKKNFSEIKLAFSFGGVKGIDKKNMIAYAPIGTFIKDKGWDGVRSFFTTDIGTCSYSRSTLLAVELIKEKTEFLINKKPTEKIIVGSPDTGFLYSVTWYTNDTEKKLECVNNAFDKDIMIKMIALANKIDG